MYHYYCRHCGERARKPGNALGVRVIGVLATPAFFLFFLANVRPVWDRRSLGLFLLFATLVTVALGYSVYQRMYPGYRDWWKWAREQKVKESK